MRRYLLAASLAGYIATIVAANWAINTVGGEDHAVPIGFGLVAPAGVYFAGLGFTFRDFVQRLGGVKFAGLAVLVGAAVSYWIGFGGKAFPEAPLGIAAASALAFACSELCDLAVFTWLQKRGFIRAVAASNAVGLVVDSVVFLALAFGSLQFVAGQVVGKAYMTGIAVLVLIAARAYIAGRSSSAVHGESLEGAGA